MPIAKRGVSLRLPAGSSLQADLIITPLIDEENVSELLIEILPVDRYLQISHEESLLTAQETSRTMIRGLAHEIKNPLGGVRGAAQLLARELSDPNLCEYTNIIIEEVDRLRNYIDKMLGPKSEPILEDINIHTVINRVINILDTKKTKKSVFLRNFDPSIPNVNIDKDMIIQSLLNIVKNAQEASTENGVIELKTRVDRNYTINSTKYNLVAVLSIIDNGIGISDEIKNKLFLPLVTDKPEGSGLGLSISQRLVSENKGAIVFKESQDKTIFEIILPIEKY